VLRLVHRREHDLAVPGAVGKLADQVADAALDHVVAQKHDEALVAQEIVADLDGVGQAQRRLLRDVGDLDAPAFALPDGLADLVAGVADDDADVVDARLADRLDHAEEDGFVGHRHQLLGAVEGDGVEPGALAAAQDQAFHLFPRCGSDTGEQLL
jgi:hypothetical protein